MSATDFWAKCPECSHVWPVVKLPMEAREAARAMIAAFCPKCGNDSPTTAPAVDIPTAQQENDMSESTEPERDPSAPADNPKWVDRFGFQPSGTYTRLLVREKAEDAGPRGPFMVRKAEPVKPRIQYQTFHGAHHAAAKLARANPHTEFVISEEVARVVADPSENGQ